MCFNSFAIAAKYFKHMKHSGSCLRWFYDWISGCVRIVLMVCFCSVTVMNSFSQEKTITYSASGKPLGDVLNDLSRISGLRFAYDAEEFGKIMVSLLVRSQPAENIIDQLRKNYSLDFRLVEGTWVVTRKPFTDKNRGNIFVSETTAPVKRQISGYVTDRATGEPLVYCNIVFPNRWGTITNDLGYFYLETYADSVRFTITHLGYSRLDTILPANLGSPAKIRLQPLMVMVKEVNVVQKEKSILEMSDQSGRVGFNPSRSSNLPRLANDDLANMLTLIPGVSLLGGALGGLSIRGSNPSDNLILLDGIPLLETGHLFGNLSVLNAGFIRQAFVSRGAFDARFGDRTSGLIELTGTTGSQTHTSMEASANLLNADLMASVPFSPKVSLTCAWRRSFVDYWQNYLFQKLLGETRLTGISDMEANVMPTVRYYDLNVKTSIRLSERSEITANMLWSGDQQMLDYEIGVNPMLYRNEWVSGTNMGFSGNWLFQSGKWHHSVSAGYSHLYHYQENESGEQVKTNNPLPPGQAKKIWTGKIKAVNPNRNKYEFDNDSNFVREFRFLWKSEITSGKFTHQFGAGFVGNYFDYRFSTINSDFRIPVDSLKNSATQNTGHLFFQQIFEPERLIRFRWGLRANTNQRTGKAYWQPRAGIEVSPVDNLRIYYNSGVYNQFLSRVPKMDYRQNVDLVWYMPDDAEKGLMRSTHHVAGIQWEKGGLLINAELYQKNTSGKQWLFARSYKTGWVTRIRYVDHTGMEKNKGFDFMAQIRHSKWYHQLAWTVSKSDEMIEGINGNKFFPSLNDRRHQVQLTELYTWRGWTASASWIFKTGQPRIKPNADLASLAFERLPFFSQLDAGFGKNLRFNRFELNGGLSLLNICNRMNVVQVDYLSISTSASSFNVRSNISTISFTPVFFLRMKIF